MFCKFCFDASKPGYNTHNIRDSASNVICPFLLNIKCVGCGYRGHTIKHCQFRGSVKKAAPAFTKSVKLAPVLVDIKSKNMFAVMICSDAEDDDDEDDDSYDDSVMDFENDPIIWGVGLTSMVGKKWADVVGC